MYFSHTKKQVVLVFRNGKEEVMACLLLANFFAQPLGNEKLHLSNVYETFSHYYRALQKMY